VVQGQLELRESRGIRGGELAIRIVLRSFPLKRRRRSRRARSVTTCIAVTFRMCAICLRPSYIIPWWHIFIIRNIFLASAGP